MWGISREKSNIRGFASSSSSAEEGWGLRKPQKNTKMTSNITKFLADAFNCSQLAKRRKRVFLLTYPCHEIHRYEAVGLKSCKFTLKITIYVNLGQFRKN